MTSSNRRVGFYMSHPQNVCLKFRHTSQILINTINDLPFCFIAMQQVSIEVLSTSCSCYSAESVSVGEAASTEMEGDMGTSLLLFASSVA